MTNPSQERARQHVPSVYHEATGYLVRCECGWKSKPCKEEEELYLDEWAEHFAAEFEELEREALDDMLDRLSFKLHTMCMGRAGGTLVWAEIHAAIEEVESKK